jgi:hypothetical protein
MWEAAAATPHDGAARPHGVRSGRRVLLLDEGWLQTMHVASALEAAGHRVTVLTANGSTASYRRRTVLWCSGPAVGDSRFLAHLDRMMRETPFEHVLPLTEPLMFRLWDAPPVWEAAIYPATDHQQRQLLRDKHVLIAHMASCGIAVPRQCRLGGDLELSAVARELGLPLVIKAATGAGGTRVHIVDTAAQLARTVSRLAVRSDWALQELVDGPTYLFGGVFHDGRPLRIYAAEKLAQHPARTGPAIRLRSDDDPALVELALRVFRELRWTGLASADFIRRPCGSYVLLEVNPRPWGSIAAARTAGVDLFTLFTELLAGDVPRAALGFTANQECSVFPRYLLCSDHWSVAGALHALRDLLGPQGEEWRDVGFVCHTLQRLYRARNLHQ